MLLLVAVSLLFASLATAEIVVSPEDECTNHYVLIPIYASPESFLRSSNDTYPHDRRFDVARTAPVTDLEASALCILSSSSSFNHSRLLFNDEYFLGADSVNQLIARADNASSYGNIWQIFSSDDDANIVYIFNVDTAAALDVHAPHDGRYVPFLNPMVNRTLLGQKWKFYQIPTRTRTDYITAYFTEASVTLTQSTVMTTTVTVCPTETAGPVPPEEHRRSQNTHLSAASPLLKRKDASHPTKIYYQTSVLSTVSRATSEGTLTTILTKTSTVTESSCRGQAPPPTTYTADPSSTSGLSSAADSSVTSVQSQGSGNLPEAPPETHKSNHLSNEALGGILGGLFVVAIVSPLAAWIWRRRRGHETSTTAPTTSIIEKGSEPIFEAAPNASDMLGHEMP